MLGVTAAVQVLRHARRLTGQVIQFLLSRKATTRGVLLAALGILSLCFAGLDCASNRLDARR